MGILSFNGEKLTQSDALVAKNYGNQEKLSKYEIFTNAKKDYVISIIEQFSLRIPSESLC